MTVGWDMVEARRVSRALGVAATLEDERFSATYVDYEQFSSYESSDMIMQILQVSESDERPAG